MLNYQDKKNELKTLKADLNTAFQGINPGKLRVRIAELEAMQNAEGFWNDVENAQKVSKESSQLTSKIARFEKLLAELDDAIETVDIVELENSEEEDNALLARIAKLSEEVEHLTLSTLLSGKYDSLNAILTLHAGAGGTEAQDWCEMLYRMYTRFVEREGWSCTELDSLAGDEAGLKSVTFRVEGDNAYGYLKAEKGVHRLVRISPFDSQARRHTSFASLEVMPEIVDTSEIEIRPEDLKVDTYRSSGAGGQHVNKTESAIRITHLPTGIVVECQDERSQIKNREKAMKVLRSRLYDFYRSQADKEYSEARRAQIGTGDRSERIRTYNFPQGRVTDHRIGLTLYTLDRFMLGEMDEMISALKIALQNKMLENIE